MADPDHQHQQPVVLDGEENPEVANPDPPDVVSATELLRARGTRLGGQRIDAARDSSLRPSRSAPREASNPAIRP
jgi:hypothetical protein